MSLLQPQSGGIPLPQPGSISEPYWQGCREGVLLFQRCLDCNAATHTPALLCAACASRSLEVRERSTAGLVSGVP
jgi:uncharacterized OB-fold protein